jgi:hypothetical protein
MATTASPTFEQLVAALHALGVPPLELKAELEGGADVMQAITSLLARHRVDQAAFVSELQRRMAQGQSQVPAEDVEFKEVPSGAAAAPRPGGPVAEMLRADRAPAAKPGAEDESAMELRTLQSSAPQLSLVEALARRLAGAHRYFENRDDPSSPRNLGLVEALLRNVDDARLRSLVADEDRRRKLGWLDWYRSVRGAIASVNLFEDKSLGTGAGAEQENFLAARNRMRTRLRAASIEPDELASMVLETCWRGALAEEFGDATREHVTDALLAVLNRVRGLGGERDAYAEFLTLLFRMLFVEVHGQGDVPIGLMQSLAGIGDVAGHIDTVQRLQMLSIAIYDTLLERLAQRNDADGADAWNRARIAANNISGHLSKLLRMDSGVAPDFVAERRGLAELVNRMQLISCCGTAKGELGTAAYPQVWRALDFDLKRLAGTDDPTAAAASPRLLRIEALLRSMNNVLSGWAYLDSTLYPDDGRGLAHGFLPQDTMLMLAFVGALLRAEYARHENRYLDEPASSLFNAGLSVERIGSMLGGVHAQGLLEHAQPFYAAGTCWALARAESLAQAFDEYNGSACLVNFLGNLARLPARHAEAVQAEAFRLAIGLAVASGENALRPDHWERMRNSLSITIGQEPMARAQDRARALRASPRELAAVMTLLYGHCRGGALTQRTAREGELLVWGEAEHFVADTAPAMRESLEVVARLADPAVTGAAAGAEASYEHLRRQVEDLMVRTVKLLEQPRLMRRLVIGVRDDGLDEERTALRRTLGDSALGRGVERQRRALLQDTGEAEAPEAPVALPATYREGFARAGTFGWLPRLRVGGR